MARPFPLCPPSSNLPSQAPNAADASLLAAALDRRLELAVVAVAGRLDIAAPAGDRRSCRAAGRSYVAVHLEASIEALEVRRHGTLRGSRRLIRRPRRLNRQVQEH